MIPLIPAAERILLMGGMNSGKSTCWVNWAEQLQKSSPESKVFVCDTDFATERMLGGWYEGTEEYCGIKWEKYKNVYAHIPVLWDEYLAFSDFAKRHPTKKDLVVVDMVDKPWEAVKENFVEKVYGQQLDEFFLEKKIGSVESKKQAGNPLGDAHGNSWDIINKRYRRFQNDVFYYCKAQIVGCTPAAAVNMEDQDRGGDSKEIKNLYGKYGYKPVGQKGLGHLFHTILLLKDERKGHTVTTVKERDIKGFEKRRELQGEVYEDFVMDYLVLVAGWRLK